MEYVEYVQAYSRADAEAVMEIYRRSMTDHTEAVANSSREVASRMAGFADSMTRTAESFRELVQSVTSEERRRVQVSVPRQAGRSELHARLRDEHGRVMWWEDEVRFHPVRFEVAGVEIPDNWENMTPDIPLPEMPEPRDFSDFQYRSYPLPPIWRNQ